jgi:NhaP-type Na+/H+ or K+/H+ antiporter
MCLVRSFCNSSAHFGIWILADRFALSGVLVIVTFAVVLSHRSTIQMPAAIRVPSYAVWDAAVFVLNALAFILVGLELGPIMDRLGRAHHLQYIAFAVAIFVTVVLARMGWVMIYNLGLRLTKRVLGKHTPRVMKPPPFKRSLLVAWCGMRGIVTLAAALALPDGSGGAAAFLYRDLIVLTAFSVVLGSLVIQGLTLRPLVMMLGLDDDGLVEREIRDSRKELYRAALDTLRGHDTQVGAAFRREYSDLLMWVDGFDELPPRARQAEIALRDAARTAAREMLNQLRLSGVIGDAAFQQLEAELDMFELAAEVRNRG